MIPDLLLAAALGLLVGLQREWSKSRVAGIRTFPLIAVFGALVGGLSDPYWVAVPAGLLAVGGLLVAADFAKMRSGDPDPGLTTEMAALVMYGAGVAVSRDLVLPAIVVSGLVAVLLQFKEKLHSLAGGMKEADARAAARLTLIALVILPALPDRAYGPYGVLNPFRIWLMVVLMVGISLAAYVSYRFLGTRAGGWAAGLLGGLISSTATTATYAERAAQPGLRSSSVAVMVTASAVMFLRVLIEIGVVAPAAFVKTAPPIALMMFVMLTLAWWTQRNAEAVQSVPEEPPSTMRTAIAFGLLYALVLFAAAAARQLFGETGSVVVAALAGLTDVDAITLSTMHLVESGVLSTDLSWRLILIAVLSNLVFKAGLVGVIGRGGPLRSIAPYFAVAGGCGVGLLIFWK